MTVTRLLSKTNLHPWNQLVNYELAHCQANLEMSYSYQSRNALFLGFRFYGFASFMFMNSAIGAREEVEVIYRSLEHAAANVDHPIEKIPADPPFRSRYQYVP